MPHVAATQATVAARILRDKTRTPQGWWPTCAGTVPAILHKPGETQTVARLSARWRRRSGTDMLSGAMYPALVGVGWHDAELERIVRDGKDARLEFSQIYVVRAIGSDQWSQEVVQAVLTFRDARLILDLTDEELTTHESRWMYACTLSEPMDHHDIQRLGTGVGPGRMHFLMHDNSTIRTEFSWVQLKLVGPFETVGTGTFKRNLWFLVPPDPPVVGSRPSPKKATATPRRP